MRFRKNRRPSQTGAILIIVLWFIALISILVATLASEMRLSAKAVFYNKQALENWSHILQAWRAAEMEIILSRMPPSPDDKERQDYEFEGKKSWKYRFNGQALKLAYPIPENTTVRIYDNTGKLNIQRLSRQQMQQLLKKRVGDDQEKLQALQDAWEDWIDGDDLKRMSGAEKEDYEKLTPPYQPRNGRLETVEEFLLIKGFAELFQGIEMDTAFTLYGNSSDINPNLATKEALLLIPGLTEEIVNKILAKRQEEDFKSRQDFNDLMEPEQLSEFAPWINFATSNDYTIVIQMHEESGSAEKTPAPPNTNVSPAVEEPNSKSAAAPEENERAFMVIEQVQGIRQPPKVLMVNPYGVVPDTTFEQFVYSEKEAPGESPEKSGTDLEKQ